MTNPAPKHAAPSAGTAASAAGAGTIPVATSRDARPAAARLLSCGCLFDEDGPDSDDGLLTEPMGVDGNGLLIERTWIDGHEVIIHRDDIPETDITTVDGLPCTTALRTVIDLAPEVSAEHLEEMVRDCLERGLFSVEQASRRVDDADMVGRNGAALLRRVLATFGGVRDVPPTS